MPWWVCEKPSALGRRRTAPRLNVFAKALRDEGELWLTAKTTLQGLGLYRESQYA